MRRRVVITGAGVVSPLGDSPATLHRALAAGACARRPIELFATDGIGCHEAGEIRGFDAQVYVGQRNLRPLDRTSRLLVVAAQLALADSGWDAAATAEREVGLIAGTTFCSVRTIAEFDRRVRRLGPAHASPFEFANSVINAAAGQTAIWHRLRGVNSTLAAGEASGLLAISQAVELVRCGRAAALLAGGVEELCFESFFGSYRAGRLCGSRQPAGPSSPDAAEREAAGRSGEWPVPFDARRNGFSLAEGAGLLMLEEAEAAAARGAAIGAEVLGYGATFAAAPGAGAVAAALARAVRVALADAATEPAEIGCLSASASGSREVDRAEALGVASAVGGAILPVTAIKAMLGEGMGASGAWQAIDLAETISGDGLLPGIAGLERIDPELPLPGASAVTRQLSRAARRRGLLTAVSADGHCVALVLGATGES